MEVVYSAYQLIEFSKTSENILKRIVKKWYFNPITSNYHFEIDKKNKGMLKFIC